MPLGLGFFHQRADPVDQLAGFQRAADAIDDLVEPAVGNGAGIDRLPAGRFFAQFGDVHVAENTSAPACAGSGLR